MEQFLDIVRFVWTWFLGVVEAAHVGAVVQAIILIIAGLFLARLARLAINRSLTKTLSAQQLMLLRRGVAYTIFILFFISALRELGFDFGVLLGAAGIVTVAVGFASQTSVSNLISGLFLVMERAVVVGDIIKVNGNTGEVLSVDLLSTKLRTFDNLLIRIPNESMVKAEITSYSRFPLRRVDLQIGVAYKEDIKKVHELLTEVADKNPLALIDPAPLIISQGFGESSVNYQFSVWGLAANYLELRNSLQEDVKVIFDEHGIEIPFPHRSLHVGALTTPFPVQVEAKEAQKESGEKA